MTDMILNIGAGNLIPGKKTLEDVLAPWLSLSHDSKVKLLIQAVHS